MKYNNVLVTQMKTALSEIDLQEPSTLEQNCSLRQQIASGDRDAKQRMIEANMPLVVRKVESFLCRFPKLSYLRDDLVGAGFIGLVNAVDCVADLESDDRVTGYLCKAIINAMIDEIEIIAPIRVARRSAKRAREQDKPLPSAKDLDGVQIAIENTDIRLCDLRDLIYSCCETERERQLIQLRESGKEVDEAADILGLSRATAFRLMARIERRFDRKNRP
jgi:RNA polymerase sigma factor (sigma-70 family)